MTQLLEICVEDAAGLRAAVDAGADRIELCSALGLGGLTPAAGMMALAARQPCPVFAMIRPRAGHFIWSADELAVMRADIAAARAAGLAGVVLGASLPDGHLDVPSLRALIATAGDMGLTLHRCFDLTPDPFIALEVAIDLGFHRILTSGQAPTAAEGRACLAALIAAARGRISIMPGSGVRLETVAELAGLGWTEIHASASVEMDEDEQLVACGFAAPRARRTDADRIRALRARLRG